MKLRLIFDVDANVLSDTTLSERPAPPWINFYYNLLNLEGEFERDTVVLLYNPAFFLNYRKLGSNFIELKSNFSGPQLDDEEDFFKCPGRNIAFFIGVRLPALEKIIRFYEKF